MSVLALPVRPCEPRGRPGAGATCSALPALAEARAARARAGRACRGSTAAAGAPRLLFVDGVLDEGAAAEIEIGPLAIETEPSARRGSPASRAGRSGSAAIMRRPGWSRSSMSRPAPPIISPARSCSTPTPRPRSSRPISANGWTNRLTAHRSRQGRAADAQSAGDGTCRVRQLYRPGDARRRRQPGRARRSPPAAATPGSTARSILPARAPMPRSPAPCSRAAGSATTPISSSATSSRAAPAARSGARSPTTRPPARSPPGSRSRATRRRPTASRSLKGLLLARSATINAKPELEIFADDVKCAHGATVGELDRSALFYLESRGVAPDEASGAAHPRLRRRRARPDRRGRRCARPSTRTPKGGSPDGRRRLPPARSTGSPTSRRSRRAGPISTAPPPRRSRRR